MLQLFATVLTQETVAICVVIEYQNVAGGLEQQSVEMMNNLAQVGVFDIHLYLARASKEFLNRFTLDPAIRVHEYEFELRWQDLARYVQYHDIRLVFYPQLWEKTHYLLAASELQYMRPAVKHVGQWHRDPRQLVDSDIASFDVLDRLVVLSKSGKEWLKNKCPKCKSVVVPNYVRQLDMEQQIKGKTPGKNVLFVGRYSADKEPMVALEIFEEALKFEPNATLTMVGAVAEPELFNQLHAYVADHNLTQVKLLKDQVNMEHFYSRADLLLMTSPKEGFPLVVSEAHQFAVPVLMFDCKVDNAKKGTVIVPQGDYDLMLSELVALLQNPERLRELGAEAKQYVAESFSTASITDQWIRLFDAVIKE